MPILTHDAPFRLADIYSKKDIAYFHEQEKIERIGRKEEDKTPFTRVWDPVFTLIIKPAFVGCLHLCVYGKLYLQAFVVPMLRNWDYIIAITALSVMEGAVVGVLGNKLSSFFRFAAASPEAVNLKKNWAMAPVWEFVVYIAGRNLKLTLISQLSNNLATEFAKDLSSLQTVGNAVTNFYDALPPRQPSDPCEAFHKAEPQKVTDAKKEYSNMAIWMLLGYSDLVTKVSSNVSEIILFFHMPIYSFNLQALVFVLKETVARMSLEQGMEWLATLLILGVRSIGKWCKASVSRELSKASNDLQKTSDAAFYNAQQNTTLNLDKLMDDKTAGGLEKESALRAKLSMINYVLDTVNTVLALGNSLGYVLASKGDMYKRMSRVTTKYAMLCLKSREANEIKEARSALSRVTSIYGGLPAKTLVAVEHTNEALKDKKQPIAEIQGGDTLLEVSGTLTSPDGRGLTIAKVLGTLTVEPGEWIAVCGPSGAGKTELIKRILGRGLGSNLSIAKIVGAEIGVVPSSQPNISNLTLEEYRASQINEAENGDWQGVMHGLGLADLRDKLGSKTPQDISGGQSARFIMACLVSRDCKLIVLDETFGKLDERSKVRARKVLNASGASVLEIKHPDAPLDPDTYGKVWHFKTNSEGTTDIVQTEVEAYNFFRVQEIEAAKEEPGHKLKKYGRNVMAINRFRGGNWSNSQTAPADSPSLKPSSQACLLL